VLPRSIWMMRAEKFALEQSGILLSGHNICHECDRMRVCDETDGKEKYCGFDDPGVADQPAGNDTCIFGPAHVVRRVSDLGI